MLSSKDSDLDCQTSNLVNTPFNNPKLNTIKKIKVVDPTHPLFGHTFPVLEWRNSPGNAGFAYVEYKHGIRLYIPIDVTDLAFTPRTFAAKLTNESIQALIHSASEVSSLCHKIPSTSGDDCLPSTKQKS